VCPFVQFKRRCTECLEQRADVWVSRWLSVVRPAFTGVIQTAPASMRYSLVLQTPATCAVLQARDSGTYRYATWR
jgi:hypothetical protein